MEMLPHKQHLIKFFLLYFSLFEPAEHFILFSSEVLLRSHKIWDKIEFFVSTLPPCVSNIHQVFSNSICENYMKTWNRVLLKEEFLSVFSWQFHNCLEVSWCPTFSLLVVSSLRSRVGFCFFMKLNNTQVLLSLVSCFWNTL